MSREDAFSDIYSRKAWGDGLSLSGPGSDPLISAPYVAYVEQLIGGEGVTSVVDLGHGDWQMWPADAFSRVTYTGLEVVPQVSKLVREQFGRPGRNFLEGDVVSASWPIADLVLCKDVLMHLPNADAAQILGKMAKFPRIVICHDVLPPQRSVAAAASQARAQLAPVFRWNELLKRKRFWRRFMVTNQEIAAGGYRPLDLGSKPWNLNEFGLRPIEVFDIPSNNPWPGVVKRIWTLEGLRR